MIKIETKDGKTNLELDGNIAVFLADTHMILCAIYNAIKEDNPRYAESYKNTVKSSVINRCFEPDETEGN